MLQKIVILRGIGLVLGSCCDVVVFPFPPRLNAFLKIKVLK